MTAPQDPPSTRERLLAAAHQLFARSGYAATPVREICNVARANPGAVSYHFGGKRQLYRAVLRRAAETLAAEIPAGPSTATTASLPRVVAALAAACQRDPSSFRLLLRDLADGGEGAVESFAPLLRNGFERLLATSDAELDLAARRETTLALLGTASPAFFLLAAWPVLFRALELDEGSLQGWILRLLGPEGGAQS